MDKESVHNHSKLVMILMLERDPVSSQPILINSMINYSNKAVIVKR